MQIFWCLITGLTLQSFLMVWSLLCLFLQNLWELSVARPLQFCHIWLTGTTGLISAKQMRNGLVGGRAGGFTPGWQGWVLGEERQNQSQLSQTKTNKQKRHIFSISWEGSCFPGTQFKLAAAVFLAVWLFASQLCYCCLSQPWARHLLFCNLVSVEQREWWFLLLNMLIFTYLVSVEIFSFSVSAMRISGKGGSLTRGTIWDSRFTPVPQIQGTLLPFVSIFKFADGSKS